MLQKYISIEENFTFQARFSLRKLFNVNFQVILAKSSTTDATLTLYVVYPYILQILVPSKQQASLVSWLPFLNHCHCCYIRSFWFPLINMFFETSSACKVSVQAVHGLRQVRLTMFRGYDTFQLYSSEIISQFTTHVPGLWRIIRQSDGRNMTPKWQNKNLEVF